LKRTRPDRAGIAESPGLAANEQIALAEFSCEQNLEKALTLFVPLTSLIYCIDIMPKLNELEPGDLICDLDDDDHFMMWAGGDDPLIENAEADDFGGIFRHSAKKIHDRINKKNVEGFAVFRCNNQAIALQATNFAIEWSTGKTDDLFIKGKKSDEFFNLKIPFNQDRLTHERQQEPEEWDARSLFRALRVLARHESQTPVSIKGWTCSSFATYCFQAAALKVLFHGGPIRKDILKFVRNSSDQKYLSIKNDINLIHLIFDDFTEIVRMLVPKGILVDGKAIDATSLKKFLNKSDSDFKNLGNITA
jgi:hypothetical protein